VSSKVPAVVTLTRQAEKKENKELRKEGKLF
jgi:hypothetical protein